MTDEIGSPLLNNLKTWPSPLDVSWSFRTNAGLVLGPITTERHSHHVLTFRQSIETHSDHWARENRGTERLPISTNGKCTCYLFPTDDHGRRIRIIVLSSKTVT